MNAFGEPVQDRAGEMRLQLHQVESQRDAFKALGHRDVQALIREALASHLSETCEKLRNEITSMEGENHRLRVELTNLKSEADRLKAENERLRASSFVTAVPSEEYERAVNQYNSIIDQHLAENERLRKAGDAMDRMLGNLSMTWPLREAWTAARDGKPTE